MDETQVSTTNVHPLQRFVTHFLRAMGMIIALILSILTLTCVLLLVDSASKVPGIIGIIGLLFTGLCYFFVAYWLHLIKKSGVNLSLIHI